MRPAVVALNRKQSISECFDGFQTIQQQEEQQRHAENPCTNNL